MRCKLCEESFKIKGRGKICSDCGMSCSQCVVRAELIERLVLIVDSLVRRVEEAEKSDSNFMYWR